MKIVIDMNLSPEWADFFRSAGMEALHWSQVGDGHAEDATIMSWARSNDYVVFTHDLDFGTLLALTRATGPSVIHKCVPRMFCHPNCESSLPAR